MENLNVEELLIIICSVVVMSYVFSIVSQYIRIPSVLLLLVAGIALRFLSDNSGMSIVFPEKIVESLGIVGLIMIVLEAGLDLKLERSKIPLIRNSFFSALFILILSSALVTAILYYWMHEPLNKCIVYAIPLSIMSSSIVIPSINPLTMQKKEFLVYEASFSDILGILAFNYLTAGDTFSAKSAGIFAINIVFSILLSLVLSFLLFLILAKVKMNIKFFLIFALLILIYAGGKILHLPSLIIILVFGLMINNWEKIKIPFLQRYFPGSQVGPIHHLLHSITAESSFLIRTFFFILFGFSISLSFLGEQEVIYVGSLIVLALFIIRVLYLRFFVRTNLFPEAFFIPRGLITIVLFYKIPDAFKFSNFNDGILFFIILVTSIVMAIGIIFYRKKPEQIVEEGQFTERADLL
ncbi:MAG: cation:proton antiporter [Chitinophagaceae bacterium]|nr:cation:proton antiporter [Chitinophagaceae bacterium]